jgi:hypothetical protein
MEQRLQGEHLVADQSDGGTKQVPDGKRWIGFLYLLGTVGFTVAFFYVLGIFS